MKKKEEEEDEDEETSSSSEETESETEEESETDAHPSTTTTTSTTPASNAAQDRQRNESAMARTDIGPLLARSAEARRGSKEDSPTTRQVYQTPELLITRVPINNVTPCENPSSVACACTRGGEQFDFAVFVSLEMEIWTSKRSNRLRKYYFVLK